MADRVVLLSGEHPTLPRAELRRLLAAFDPDASMEDRSPTVIQVSPGDVSATDEALRRMALCHAVSEHWGHGDLLECVEAAAQCADGKGSMAVRASRKGTAQVMHTGDIQKEVGQSLADAGHPIDLNRPDRVVTAWLHDDHVVVGERLWETDRSRFELRLVEERAHFSPISMHPRRAASLVHLAEVPPGGRILDPFCGTGGILLEAAMDGYDAWGSDVDDWMVQGTTQALADAADEPLPGTVFRADIADVPDLVDAVDGIVTDLPYGRASTTELEDVAALYRRSFATFADLLPKGRCAVIGCAEIELGRTIADHGFTIEEEHAEYVHKSLTRHYIVARRG